MPSFTYMGTKKRLARDIAGHCSRLPAGPFLDLFSGISAAGACVSSERQIWCNDVQAFSTLLTSALYLSHGQFDGVERVAVLIEGRFTRNRQILSEMLSDLVVEEADSFLYGDHSSQIRVQARIAETLPGLQYELRSMSGHCLFTSTYSGTYFGLQQAIDLDSIRSALDEALIKSEIVVEEHRWCVLALCNAVVALSNSTGHFAQYLRFKTSNASRVLAKRRRKALSYWKDALFKLRPIGMPAWRRSNRVFNGDALDILQLISDSGALPSVIYADPPYTNDQYSRYYHLLDTVVLYDYPTVSGKGICRSGRFSSDFSLKSRVTASFEKLIRMSAQIGTSLVISYPDNGLMSNSYDMIPRMMKEAGYKFVSRPFVIASEHSTLGASKGRQKEPVQECIFIAHH